MTAQISFLTQKFLSNHQFSRTDKKGAEQVMAQFNQAGLVRYSNAGYMRMIAGNRENAPTFQIKPDGKLKALNTNI